MTAIWWILGILLFVFLLYLYLIKPCLKHPDASQLIGRLYAHRGLHDGNDKVAENSLPAFQRAVDAGYGMELDVQLTKDGRLVVFHDETLKRVCGIDRRLSDMSYEELRAVPLPDGTPIPTFDEVLALVDGRAPLIVEVKYHGDIPATAKATCDRLRSYKGAYCVESFHPVAMGYFRKNAPDVIRGQLASGGKRNKDELGPIYHFAMKYLLGNVISRPHFIAYDVKNDRNLSMLMMKKWFHPMLAAWTVRDQGMMDYAKRWYHMPIFERFIPKD